MAEIMNDLYHKRLTLQVKICEVLHSDLPPEELARYTGFLLNFLGEKSRRRFIAALEPHAIHPRVFGLMTVLAERPGITQQELAGIGNVDPSSMVAVLDEMEAQGLAERKVDPVDRRRRAVRLTDAGRRKQRALAAEAQKTLDEFLAPLSAEERDELNRLLRKLAGLDPA
jgi:MarR family transcriptional regulator, lower aerobic nicotinate degradation pathway regulator